MKKYLTALAAAAVILTACAPPALPVNETVTGETKETEEPVTSRWAEDLTEYLEDINPIYPLKEEYIDENFKYIPDADEYGNRHLAVSTNGESAEVYSVADGTVVYEGSNSVLEGLGQFVIIQHHVIPGTEETGTFYSVYSHLDKDEIKVMVNEDVSAGQVIGMTGQTGSAKGIVLGYTILSSEDEYNKFMKGEDILSLENDSDKPEEDSVTDGTEEDTSNVTEE